jgi:TetR/AcrR family transcriptional regulator, cholesterol catabolism regulator
MASRTTSNGSAGSKGRPRGGATAATPSEGDRGTRDHIVQVATELFLQRGYEGTSVKAIATAIGISTPALYWHFPSKQDIFFAAMERTLTDFLEAVHSQLISEQPRERFVELVRAHTYYQLERQAATVAYQATFGFRGLVHKLPAKYRKRIAARQRGYADEFRHVLAAGRDQGVFDFDDLTVMALAVIQHCEFPTSWYDADGRLSPAEVADRYADIALRMVGAKA